MSRRRLTSDREGYVIACPDCDHAGCLRTREGTDTHRCAQCGAIVTDPVERERHPSGHRNAKYSDLSPEDVGLPAMGER